MSHHRYQTEAVILGSVPRGESDRVFFLFTKDMGLIPASAQGIRNLPSKLRYTLSDFGALEVDLIRMEDMWRIVDAEERPIIFSAPHSDALRTFVRIAGLCGASCAVSGKKLFFLTDVCNLEIFF